MCARKQRNGEAVPREDFQGATNRANRARRTRRFRAQVTEGTRDHSSNHNSDFAVCLYCFLDAVTCGALKPNDMWYYSIKYDDGEEEHKVGPARIFPNK